MPDFYFLGIGGTAMASVAAAMRASGAPVTGSDHGVYPPMSDFLAASGITYHDAFDAAHIAAFLHPPAAARPDANPSPTVFVIGNAISRGNPELEAIIDARLPYVALAALVGERMISGCTSLVVSGTHGKTTASSLAAWVLETAGRAPGFLIGGIPANFGEGCRTGAGDVFVSEGDEYDTAFFDKRPKFVHYRPDIAIINNIEYDHADIYDSLDSVIRGFRQLVVLIPRGGLLLVNGDDANAVAVAAHAQSTVESFGLGETNDWRALVLSTGGDGTRFDVEHRTGGMLQRYSFAMPLAGAFNVRNALGVIAAALRLGVSAHDIQAGLSTFLGVKRRMEVYAESGGITIIDDFAHHPTAIRETLLALRAKYPGRRVWALFEPRSNTTTRNIFQRELTEALANADAAVIGSVNRPERYASSELLDTAGLAAELRTRGVDAHDIPDVGAMVAHVLANCRSGDVIAILSNGAFGGAHRRIADGLETAVADRLQEPDRPRA